jgi:multidrug efflux pump
MRHAMGVAVFAGMIGVTMFGLFLTPVFYVLLRRLSGNRPLKLHGDAPHVEAIAGAPHTVPSAGASAPAAPVLETQE